MAILSSVQGGTLSLSTFKSNFLGTVTGGLPLTHEPNFFCKKEAICKVHTFSNINYKQEQGTEMKGTEIWHKILCI